MSVSRVALLVTAAAAESPFPRDLGTLMAVNKIGAQSQSHIRTNTHIRGKTRVDRHNCTHATAAERHMHSGQHQ